MINQENLNIDAICEVMDEKVSNLAEGIKGNCDEDSEYVTLKVFDDDWLLFDFCNKDAIIDSINECLDDMAVTDYEIDEDKNFISFEIA